MLISRTPFRISLGGGSTDLPSYSRQYGGFIFGVAIQMYIDIAVRTPKIYDKIDLQYLQFESVDSVDEVKHPIGREALILTGVNRCVSIHFKSETPIGTGLGGSGSCAVGLLNALWWHRGVGAIRGPQELAEQAFRITQKLKLDDGKQDPYIGALGGFVVMEIAKDDSVQWHRPKIGDSTRERFLNHSFLLYTGIPHDSDELLKAQDPSRVQHPQRLLELKHRTKELGREVLATFESGNLEAFALLMNQHWQLKKEMSDKMTAPKIDEIHDFCMKNGALGGKLVGAGGGGYLLFYCRTVEDKMRLAEQVNARGARVIPLEIDDEGTRVHRINL